MDRGDRKAVASFHSDAELVRGGRLELDEAAAHHARVRRLAAGADVRLTNGRGALADARIERMGKSTLTVLVSDVATNVPAPGVALYLPVADRDRMLWLAEKCTELGVRAWQPVIFRRSASVSPRGEGTAFDKKLRARMISALEQSGGAWLPEIMTPVPLGDALVRPETHDGDRYLLERGVAPLVHARPRASAAVMVGPEGGIEDDERAAIVAHGWTPSSLGDTTLRFETAGVVAVGILRGLLAEQRA